MGAISIELWRARIGGFSCLRNGTKRKCSKRVNSGSKKLALTLVFVLFCVNLISSKPLTKKEKYKDTDNNNVYADTATAHVTSNRTTNPLDTTQWSSTTAPLSDADNFFERAGTIINWYLGVILFLCLMYLQHHSQIVTQPMDPMFRKETWQTLIKWNEVFKHLTQICMNVSLIFLPFSGIGSLIPPNTSAKLVFRYIVWISLLLTMSFFVLCLLLQLSLSILANKFFPIRSLQSPFLSLLRTMTERSNNIIEITCRVIEVVMKVIMKILFLPFCYIYKKCQSDYLRIEDNQERTRESKVLFLVYTATKISKRYLPFYLFLTSVFIVRYQKKHDLMDLTASVVAAPAAFAVAAVMNVLLKIRSSRQNEMNRIPGNKFQNGLPELDPDHHRRLQSVLGSVMNNKVTLSKIVQEKVSDNLCKCSLKLGSSEKYKKIVDKHRRLGAQNVNDPEKIFSGVKGTQLFKEIEKGEKRNYGRVVTGKEKDLVIVPPLFKFNSRIGTYDTIEENALNKVTKKNSESKAI